MYDIAIIGGGPSGSTLARLLGAKYRVLLLERRTFLNPLYSQSPKCCGGLIAPDAQKMLAAFGLGLPKSVLVSPQLFSVRTVDMQSRIERHYQRHYLNIDREEFDKWLESLVPAGTDVENGCSYLGHAEEAGHVRLSYAKEGQVRQAEARLVVGADGAFSKVRRGAFSGARCPKTYICIQEWLESDCANNYYGAFFDSGITDFYSWTIPKENFIIVGSALSPDADASAKFAVLKDKLGSFGIKFGACVRRNGSYLYRPQVLQDIILGGSSVALVGEAAGFISPSSAEGLSYAFRSALALAKALESGIEQWEHRYRKNVLPLRMNIAGKILKAPFMYNAALRSLAMRSGLMSIKMEASSAP